jgi:hypothetical protein
MLGHAASNGEKEGPPGQATVEFALVILVVMMLILAIIDFSRLFFAYATMANAVREGARYGVVHAPGNDVDQTKLDVIEHARAMMVLVGGEATVTIEYPGGDDPDDEDFPEGCTTPYYCRVHVRAESNFNAWTPFIPDFTIVTQATMHFE